MIWNMYFTGTEENVTQANSQINSNCGFPDPDTHTWDVPTKAYEQEFWFIAMPNPEGYRNSYGVWTQAQMIDGVTNVTEQEAQPDWFPPAQ